MEDNKLDMLLQAHFSEDAPLDDRLVLKTKQRLREAADKKESFLLGFVQIGFWLMSIAFGGLVFITVGVNIVVIATIIGYIGLFGLVAIPALVGSKNITRRTIIHEQ
ncbi:MAG: hypothetical protein FWH20_03525 [Oscillospiraceae bacterium]|nr:hypothetical protein [Oscillospiraceae bacterium]